MDTTETYINEQNIPGGNLGHQAEDAVENTVDRHTSQHPKYK